jgi:hypothetical protein
MIFLLLIMALLSLFFIYIMLKIAWLVLVLICQIAALAVEIILLPFKFVWWACFK